MLPVRIFSVGTLVNFFFFLLFILDWFIRNHYLIVHSVLVSGLSQQWNDGFFTCFCSLHMSKDCEWATWSYFIALGADSLGLMVVKFLCGIELDIMFLQWGTIWDLLRKNSTRQRMIWSLFKVLGRSLEKFSDLLTMSAVSTPEYFVLSWPFYPCANSGCVLCFEVLRLGLVS